MQTRRSFFGTLAAAIAAFPFIRTTKAAEPQKRFEDVRKFSCGYVRPLPTEGARLRPDEETRWEKISDESVTGRYKFDWATLPGFDLTLHGVQVSTYQPYELRRNLRTHRRWTACTGPLRAEMHVVSMIGPLSQYTKLIATASDDQLLRVGNVDYALGRMSVRSGGTTRPIHYYVYADGPDSALKWHVLTPLPHDGLEIADDVQLDISRFDRLSEMDASIEHAAVARYQ